MKIPRDFPVQPKAPSKCKAPATCGTCGRTWDDAIPTSYTPAPSARCPFEAFHDEPHALACQLHGTVNCQRCLPARQRKVKA